MSVKVNGQDFFQVAEPDLMECADLISCVESPHTANVLDYRGWRAEVTYITKPEEAVAFRHFFFCDNRWQH